MGVLGALGSVEGLRDEGDGGDVGDVGGFGDATTANDNASEAAKGIGDAGTGVPFGGECTRGLVCGDYGSLPRLLVHAVEVVAGEGANVVRLAEGHARLRAVLSDDQARVAVGVERRRLDEVGLGDLVVKCHETAGGGFEGGGVGGI